jgi:hypothetical protein
MSATSDAQVIKQRIEQYKDIPTEKILWLLNRATVSKIEKKAFNEILKLRGVKKLFYK